MRNCATGMTTGMMMVMVFMIFIMETMMKKTHDEKDCDADGGCNWRLLTILNDQGQRSEQLSFHSARICLSVRSSILSAIKCFLAASIIFQFAFYLA